MNDDTHIEPSAMKNRNIIDNGDMDKTEIAQERIVLIILMANENTTDCIVNRQGQNTVKAIADAGII